MSLKEKIEADIKAAMIAKDKDALRALRGIKSMILLAETEKGASEALSQESEIKLLQKAAKQRKESLEVYEKQGRADLAEIEKSELTIIERYLPAQLSGDALRAEIEKIIKSVGASSAADMGKVMGLANKELAGKADGKAISEVVKSILN
jgi:uncharacterized protein YqeY